MIDQLLLALVLMNAAAPEAPPNSTDALEAVVNVPKVAQAADLIFMLRKWDAAASSYQRLVDANPTIGLFWYRLGISRLETGKYAEAIKALEKAEQLGSFQLNPVRPGYRGESAWGIAAAHARLGHTDEAWQWTRKSLAQGLRDIRQFHKDHFKELLNVPEYRKLVWAVDQPDKLSRDESYRLDIRFLVHEAKRIHYAPFRFTPESEIDTLATKLETDVPGLNDDQVFARFSVGPRSWNRAERARFLSSPAAAKHPPTRLPLPPIVFSLRTLFVVVTVVGGLLGSRPFLAHPRVDGFRRAAACFR